MIVKPKVQSDPELVGVEMCDFGTIAQICQDVTISWEDFAKAYNQKLNTEKEFQ